MNARTPLLPRSKARRFPCKTCAFTLGVLGIQSLPAYALEGCRPTESLLVCRLHSVLTMLDAAAAILAILLILAIAAAVRAYRRKSRKLTPDDITPDAQ